MTRTVGVEEELLLVDPGTGAAVAAATQAVHHARPERTSQQGADPGGVVVEELQQEQIETDTRPCADLTALDEQIRSQRAAAAEVAEGVGARVVALATSPLEVEPTTTAKSRYGQMVREFGVIGRENLSCGMHVHVEIASPEEGVAVLDRIRPWLQVLLAISVNSPFSGGQDTGYASYRTQNWSRWPSAGPTGAFGSVDSYRATVDALLVTGTVLDEGMVYFDARLSRAYPTVEIRVADVCLRAEDAVLVAALARGLVETSARSWEQGVPAPDVRTEVLRLSTWRASRSGTDAALVHPVTGRPAPARVVVDALVQHVREALADSGDADVVADLVARLTERGTGARRQREVREGAGRLSRVVLDAVELTLA